MKLLLCWLIASPAFGAVDYSGFYYGKGHGKSTALSYDGPCAPVQLRIRQTHNRMQITETAYTCGQWPIQHLAYAFDMDGNDIYLDGEKVGAVTIDGLFFQYLDQGWTKYLTLKRKGGGKFELFHYMLLKENELRIEADVTVH